MLIRIYTVLALVLILVSARISAQGSGEEGKEYVIEQIVISGTRTLDNATLLKIARINVGDRIKIPGEKISRMLKDLWAQSLFSKVDASYDVISGDKILLKFHLEELARLGEIELVGTSKREKEDLEEKLEPYINKALSAYVKEQVKKTIKNYYQKEGYFAVQVELQEGAGIKYPDKRRLIATIDKKKKITIKNIHINGNEHLSPKEIKSVLKNTRERRFYHIFGSKKFIPEKFQEDKELLVQKYKSLGFNDIKIVSDEVKLNDDSTVDITLNLNEGQQYRFGSIKFMGNTVFNNEQLSELLQIKPGDVYDELKLNAKLFPGQKEDDLASLYLNRGYLFSHITPVIEGVEGDRINLTIKIYEGKIAKINKVLIKGNDRTSDRVILREIRTRPGDTFDKSQLIRSLRELAQLGFFDETKLIPDLKPDPNNSTVDILYNLAEKSSDQIQLSAGIGGGAVIGTLGLTFRNFSARKLFSSDWHGVLPAGDGQTLGINASSTGRSYQSLMFMFAEPWFGGTKRRLFSLSFSYAINKEYDQSKDSELRNKITLSSLTIGLGEFLKWPDDYFQLGNTLNLRAYSLLNYPHAGDISTGQAYTISYNPELSRNSFNSPIFPTQGSHVRLSLELTPPYSLLNSIDYSDPTLSSETKYRFTEFYKWKFDASWCTTLIPSTKLVANVQAHFGFLGAYNKTLGLTGFSRFKLGGDGMGGFQYLSAAEIIGLRGYSNESIYPSESTMAKGSPIYQKIVIEFRHPILMTEQLNLYALAFLEAGNTYENFNTYDPFEMKRSAGLGIRIFLPIFGTLGLEWGYGFDPTPVLGGNKGQLHFSINQSLGNF